MTFETGHQDHALFERLDSHVGLVTLNRPDKRNAIGPEMASALERIVEAAENDPEIRVMILTSCDDRVFCAGADLGAVAAGEAEGLETSRSGFGGFVYSTRMKPWIAAVEGLAVAGGMELALACDMVVVSDNARFGLPEVKRGLMAAAGGIHRLASALPRNIANELLATGLEAVKQKLPESVVQEMRQVTKEQYHRPTVPYRVEVKRRNAAANPKPKRGEKKS